MNIQEYTINSAKTFKNREIGVDPQMTDLLHCAIGIVTETGELLLSVEVKNNVDHINTAEEIGDIMWYVANLARLLDYDLSKINIPKMTVYENRSTYVKFLVVEASELMDHFKRAIYYFKETDFNYMTAKIDLLLINCAQLSEVLGINFENCLQKNIDKLAKRYPGNFFTPEAAVNRDLENERKELEK